MTLARLVLKVATILGEDNLTVISEAEVDIF